MERRDKELVWVHPHPVDYWCPAKVINRLSQSQEIEVEDSEGITFKIKEENAMFVSPDSLVGVENMITLGDFNEGTLLHNVRVRYLRDQIYTSIGSAILLALNPYQKLPIYGDAQRNLYSGRLIADFEQAPPHLFKMAELSYQSMILDRKNQSIIITGESGAGKTESTKIVLRYLANVQKKEFSKESLHAAGASAIVDPSPSSSAPTMHTFDIENKILYTNPVLEAFGNAKTVRNNNSSRFGKFIQIYFNTNQTIYSAEISNYLLEKSRIIMQSPLERNYHIFHMLLHAAPEEFRRKYKVGDEQTFPYVNEQYQDREEFIPVDVEAWEEMNKCMQGLQFTPSEKDGIFRIVGAVLHLGKIDLEGSEDHSSLVAGSESTKHVSELMGITISQLEALLCSKSIIDPSTKKKLTQSVGKGIAEYNRETFSKIVYDKLFDWIVSRVNVEIRKPLTGQAATYKSIGLLDIFGFEIFEVNSFEQLCINFTNEKLQQHFNDHMFKLEQKEYQEEKIDFSGVEFADNLDVINLIEKRPKCIFSFLDEQCAFATGTDHQFWEKIQSNFKNTNAFLAGPKMKKNLFGIAHFAGEVFYDVTNFLDKNKNSKNKDMDEILAGSSVNFISQLFSEKPGSKRAPGQQERIKSVSAQFLDQLDELLKCLNESASLYIRCVKPNRKMAYRVFESELVCKQLRCAGMLEAIRIRKCGFPVRRSFEQFCSANKLLFLQFGVKESSSGSKRAATEQFLKALDKEGIVKAADKTIQIGKTKVFMKEQIRNLLEILVEKSLVVFVQRLQRAYRSYQRRKELKKRTKARLAIQRWWRRKRARIQFLRLLEQKKLSARIIIKFFRAITFYRRFKNMVRRMKISLESQAKQLTPRHKELGSPGRLAKLGEKKNMIQQKFSTIIQQSFVPGEDENDIDREDDEEGYQNPLYREVHEDEDPIELHPKFVAMQLELNKMKQELEILRSRPPSVGISQAARVEIDRLQSVNITLSKQLKEKDALLKIAKAEAENARIEKDKKVAEIVKLQKEIEKNLYDEGLFAQLDQVNTIMSQKNDENAALKKQARELKQTIKLLKESVGMQQGSESQALVIAELQQRLEYLQNQSIMRESRLSLEESRIDKMKKSTKVLKEESECCRELVHNLVKLLKFKRFELMIMQKQYVDQAQDEKTEELVKKYHQMKPQEQIINERIEKGMAQLMDLQDMEAQLEAEDEDYPPENFLPQQDY